MRKIMFFLCILHASAHEVFTIPKNALNPINILGVLESGELARLSPMTDGSLKKIHHQYGEYVHSGDIVYEYSNPEEQDRLLSLSHEYNHNLRQWRLKDENKKELDELLEIGAISPTEHQTKTESIQDKLIQLKQVEHHFNTMAQWFNLSDKQIKELRDPPSFPFWTSEVMTLKIKAPIDGVMIPPEHMQTPTVPSQLKAHENIAIVANDKKLSATFMVPTDYLPFLRVQQHVTLHSVQKNKGNLNGIIRSISYPLNGASLKPQYPVVVDISEKTQHRKESFGTTMRLTISPNDRYDIPKDCVFWEDDQAFVRIATQGKWIKKPIRIQQSKTESPVRTVTYDLQPGSVILRHAHY